MGAKGKWRPEWDALLGTKPDDVLAREFGVFDTVVGYHRKKHGLPVCKSYPVPCAKCRTLVARAAQRRDIICADCQLRQRRRLDAAWRAAHRQQFRDYHRAWRQAHPEVIRAHRRRAYANRKALTEETMATVPCLDCGMFHSPERRAAILRRMLPCYTSDLHEAWPCIWGPGGREYRNSAGSKMLHRDLQAIGAVCRVKGDGYYYPPQRSAA